MILSLLRRNPPKSTIEALYGVIVAQARLPSFYLRYGVPDTVDGRFDMIVLHMVLLNGRISAEPARFGEVALHVDDDEGGVRWIEAVGERQRGDFGHQ